MGQPRWFSCKKRTRYLRDTGTLEERAGVENSAELSKEHGVKPMLKGGFFLKWKLYFSTSSIHPWQNLVKGAGFGEFLVRGTLVL